MASKFICECGYHIRTNMFEGHGIYRMISDNEINLIEDSEPAKSVIDLWLKSQELIRCKGCGSLYLWDSDKKDYVQHKKVSDQ